MNQYEALKKVFKVGHPISVKVIRHELMTHFVNYRIHVETDKGIMGFFDFDRSSGQLEKPLPKIGESITAIIKNYNSDDNMLILSVNPIDLKKSTINSFEQFYSLIDQIKEGTELTGTILNIQPFGLFVDIGQDFIGLIDIGHSSFNHGTKLPP